MSFDRKDFGAEVTITRPNGSVKVFTVYYPFCYDTMDELTRSSLDNVEFRIHNLTLMSKAGDVSRAPD